MATFNQSLTRIQRFLRDPDANIWDTEQIRIYFNDAQFEVSEKVNHIERIHSYRWPPFYTWTYLRDWEVQHCEGDRYQALHIWPTRDMTISYSWEPGYMLDSMSTADDGTRFLHPWESVYCSPADVVRIPLHEKFHRGKFAAFDEQPIDPLTEKEIASQDQFYKTKAGSPISYYRPDEFENDMVLYPRPSSVTWDDTSLNSNTPSESFSDTSGEGLIVHAEDGLDEQDIGIIYDTVDTDNHLFMVFEAIPDKIVEEVDTWDDEIKHWPPYMLPMVEYATLERCYGADTDGFIPSLRDYWALRKKIGIEGIKVFKQLRLTDRDFRLGGQVRSVRSAHPRLPSGYPSCP